MKNVKNSQILAAKRSRAKIQRNVARSRRLLCGISSLSKRNRICKEGQANWYYQRKRASQRLKSLSGGALNLVEDGYKGDMRRHWIKSMSCDHVFKASLKEIVIVGPEKICPFCNGTSEMRRFGSIEAIQEHVHSLSHGNIAFMPENNLGTSDDDYKFACNIHHFIFEGSFEWFLRDPECACHICNL